MNSTTLGIRYLFGSVLVGLLVPALIIYYCGPLLTITFPLSFVFIAIIVSIGAIYCTRGIVKFVKDIRTPNNIAHSLLYNVICVACILVWASIFIYIAYGLLISV